MDQNFCLDGQANPDHDTLLVKFSELVEFEVEKVFVSGEVDEVRKMLQTEGLLPKITTEHPSTQTQLTNFPISNQIKTSQWKLCIRFRHLHMSKTTGRFGHKRSFRTKAVVSDTILRSFRTQFCGRFGQNFAVVSDKISRSFRTQAKLSVFSLLKVLLDVELCLD